jgi:glycosyltransferase involved in cell wall biosynthesis
MRIAILLHDLGPGGSEKVALSLASAWQAARAEVSLLLGNAAGPLVPPAGIAVHALDPVLPRGPGSRLRLGLRMAALVKAVRPDILFLPGNWHLPAALPLALRLGRARPPFVAKLSNPPIPRLPPLVRLFGGPVFRGLVVPVDAFAAWPPPAAARLQRLLPRTAVVPIPNPPFSVAPLARSAAAPARRLVAAGRLVPQKDFALAIAAMTHLPELSLDIAGDGPERPALVRQIERLGLGERVRIHGHMPAIAPLLAAADLFLLTSRYEGTPAVLLEALAAGIPVVATPCSDMVESLVTPGVGQLVARPTPERLAQAVRRQLARPGPFPPQRFPDYAPGHVAQRYLDLFESLLAAR